MKLVLTIAATAAVLAVAVYVKRSPVPRAELVHDGESTSVVQLVGLEILPEPRLAREIPVFARMSSHDGPDGSNVPWPAVQSKPDALETAPMPRELGSAGTSSVLDWANNSVRAENQIRGLEKVPEIRIPTNNRVYSQLRRHGANGGKLLGAPDLVSDDPSIGALPLIQGPGSFLGQSEGFEFARQAREYREGLTSIMGSMEKSDEAKVPPTIDEVRKKINMHYDHAGRLLTQILRSERAYHRLVLIEMLRKIETKESTEALAKLAAHDIDERIRERAVDILQQRPAEDWRPILMSAFRHIWQPAAMNASEALTRLGAKDSLNDLLQLIDAPDPSAPFTSGLPREKPSVRELIRINHNLNCFVCHATVNKTPQTEKLAFAVPQTDQALSNFPSAPPYYQNREADLFVRIDLTYLRPEFSVMLPVNEFPKWPTQQRFDFVTRIRPATEEEIAAAREKPLSYPQREAVLMTLRNLTGQNGGSDSETWKRIVANINRD